MSNQKPPSFYTTREAAHKIGVSLTTIQLWVEAGVLSAWKTAGGHRRIPREAVETMLAEQRAPGIENPAGKPPCIVIVEDEPVHRELYRLKFGEWNLPVKLYLAEDGFEGLVMVGKYAPQLVIADLSMPGMDGFEMIRRLTQSKEIRTPEIVVVTALTPTEIEAHGGLPADIPVYSKPAPLGVLRHIVERTLQNAGRRAL